MTKPAVMQDKILCLATGLAGSFLVNQSLQFPTGNIMGIQVPILQSRRGVLGSDCLLRGQFRRDGHLGTVHQGIEHRLLLGRQRDCLCCHGDGIGQRTRSWRHGCASHHLTFRGGWLRSSGVSWQPHSRRCTASTLPRALLRIRTSFPSATGLATSSLVEDSLRWRTLFPVQGATDA